MSEQIPLKHKFNMKTTGKQVMAGVNLQGKTILVTGGYGGLGLASIKLLAKADAQLIVPARNLEKAKQALAKVKNVNIHEMDLMSAESIHSFAEWVKINYAHIDILINAAGIMYLPLSRNAAGVESQMQTNHFGHFQLTLELLPLLGKGSRIVNVASRAQADANFIADYGTKDNWNWQDESKYEPKKGYDQSKATNILFTVALEKRLAARGIHNYAVHPGAIPLTGIGRHVVNASPQLRNFADKLNLIRVKDFFDGMRVGFDLEKGFKTGKYRYLKTTAQGIATILWAATSPELANKGGIYLEDVNIARQASATDSGLFGVRPWSNDLELAENLWKFSENLTGYHFIENE